VAALTLMLNGCASTGYDTSYRINVDGAIMSNASLTNWPRLQLPPPVTPIESPKFADTNLAAEWHLWDWNIKLVIKNKTGSTFENSLAGSARWLEHRRGQLAEHGATSARSHRGQCWKIGHLQCLSEAVPALDVMGRLRGGARFLDADGLFVGRVSEKVFS
jgi:hypothetical protein